jgi:hypothetical protein
MATRVRTISSSDQATGSAIGTPVVRGQRQGDKQQKEPQDQQDGQAPISDPILPGIKRCSLLVEDRSSQIPMHDG